MCTRNQAEEILHSVYHACSPIFGRIHDAYLYGSYARGDFNPESDIDILLTVDLEQAEIAKHRNDVAKPIESGARYHRFRDRQAAGAVQTLSDSAAVLPKRCAGGHSLCRHMNEKRCRRRGWNTQLNAFPRRGTYLKQGIIRVQRTVGLTVIRK